jgi:anhydro-N-acetylmuramic acid kinase
VYETLSKRIASGEAVVAGVLSGTSADGIDVVLARFGVADRGALELRETLAGETVPFPPSLGAEVRVVLDGAPTDLRRAALLNRDLGRAFGEAVATVAAGAGLAVDLVGSHGQTVWHHDDREASGPATLQLGDGCHVAEAAGAPVVSDLRQRDVAAGGGGAPLSAYGDEVLFPRAPRPLAILNLGGMANLTWLPAEGPPLAFDTGPAGALLDGLARRLLDRPWDQDGATARAGTSDPAWVAAALEHPFFRAPVPKSTGRDTFGEAWIDGLLVREATLSPRDLLASATAVVATSIADALRIHLPGMPRELLLAGGGRHNRALVEALTARLTIPLATTEGHGVDPDLREALVFAALAARACLGLPSTAPETTGAARGRILGKWSPGTR